MSLKYISRIEDSADYYIDRCYDFKSLTSLFKELEEAEKQIKEYKERIMAQYNKATQTVEQIKVIAFRNKNEYSQDKKVKINIQVRKVKLYDGQEVTNDFIYGDSKEFSYQDKKSAVSYVLKMLDKYPGARYQNDTPYKFMNI